MAPEHRIRTVSLASSASWKRIGSDEPGHEYLIDLLSTSDNMADRFPSLEDFGAGERFPLLITLRFQIVALLYHPPFLWHLEQN